MKQEDIPQVSLIESDAFPQLFPSTSFRKELQRQISTVIVAISTSNIDKTSNMMSPNPALIPRSDRPYRSGNTGWRPGMEFLTGFVLIWNVTNEESHVISIGTRRSHRRKGIGELLLYSAMARCIDNGIESLTLEVRVSNKAAISLYEKYGLDKKGTRKAYYADNHEDAHIMTVEDIQSSTYKRLLDEKWDILRHRISN
ncbi:GNAT family N-acetyltransferase [Chloroflexi bacterium]|nr:GNAT family N-acetyltransferase [Chloroflexota bacterium]